MWNLLKSTIKTPEWRHWGRSGVFLVDFAEISQVNLVFPVLNGGTTSGMQFSQPQELDFSQSC